MATPGGRLARLLCSASGGPARRRGDRVRALAERRNPAPIFMISLDYCYWLGVRMALRDNRRSRHGLTTLKGMGQKPGAAATNT
jgi:hypothetical protein